MSRSILRWSAEQTPQRRQYNEVVYQAIWFIMNHSLTTSDVPVLDYADYTVLKPYLRKKSNYQHAFAIILHKDGVKPWKSPTVIPKYVRGEWTHAEVIVIKAINAYLNTNGAEVKVIWVYTYYSPCITQGKMPCMYQLTDNAHQWHAKYNINTNVIFSEPWGLSGQFTHSDIETLSCSKLQSGQDPGLNAHAVQVFMKHYKEHYGTTSPLNFYQMR